MSGYKTEEYREAAEACVRDGEADIALRYFIETGLVKPSQLRIGNIAVQNLLIDQMERRSARRSIAPRMAVVAVAGVIAISVGAFEGVSPKSSPLAHNLTTKPAPETDAYGQIADSSNWRLTNPVYKNEVADIGELNKTSSGYAVNTNETTATVSINNNNVGGPATGHSIP